MATPGFMTRFKPPTEVARKALGYGGVLGWNDLQLGEAPMSTPEHRTAMILEAG